MKAYNVLIADDDPDNFEIARGAFDTRLSLKINFSDLVLMDINMPVLNGLVK
jgi:CheY-like chemotaxis protein